MTFPLVCLLGACQPQLGQCDDEEARTVVFDSAGYPAYAGQALVQTSCGNGAFCHSSGIPASQRVGAPHGMSFDLVGSRSDSDLTPDEDAIARLRAARQKLFDLRFSVFGTVQDGSMPPGEAGEMAVADEGYQLGSGEPLPGIASSAGQEILRGWLACGSPVVERTTEPRAGRVPGEACPPGEIGDCYVRNMGVVVDPTWSSIYEHIIEPRCVGCHGPGEANYLEPSQLDLRDPRTAYDALVSVVVMGDECVGDSTLRVAPGDADGSNLVHKLEGEGPSGASICGDVMPVTPAPPVPADQIAAVRDWIDAGALDN